MARCRHCHSWELLKIVLIPDGARTKGEERERAGEKEGRKGDIREQETREKMRRIERKNVPNYPIIS